MFSVYEDRMIKLMKENKFEQYLKIMANSELPTDNKLKLIILKYKEYQEEANKQIMAEAMERREKLNG